MDAKQLEQLMRLSRKTGDTLIIAGNEGEEPLVVMPVSRYENLVLDKAEEHVEEAVYEEMYVDEEFDLLSPEVPAVEPVIPQNQETVMGVPIQRRESMPQKPLQKPVAPPRMGSQMVERTKKDLKEFVSKRQVDESPEERFYLEPID